jgi:hypothetical protein
MARWVRRRRPRLNRQQPPLKGKTHPPIPSSIILIAQCKVPFIVQVHITHNSEANLLTSLPEKPLPRLTQPFSHGLVNLLKSLPEELS